MTSLQEELEELRRDYSVPDWDGYGAFPLNETSAQLAEEFITHVIKLYPQLPLPSLCPHPSGDLGMDWVMNGHQLVVSFDSDYWGHFAFRWKNGSSTSGTFPFSSEPVRRYFIPIDAPCDPILKHFFGIMLEETSHD